MSEPIHDVIIIGAGPCGLACGIDAQAKGLDYLILEKGNVTEAVRKYPKNMVFFSTSEMIEIGQVPFVTHDIRPTRVEALKYYRKVARHFDLNISLFTTVEDIQKRADYFTLQTNQGTFHARYVVVATGYYDIPRFINVEGEDLPHVSHYYDEAYQYTDTNVLIVGGANSAIEAALDLYRSGTNVTMVHLMEDFDKNVKYWIFPDVKNRVKKGEIQAHFRSKVQRITPQEVIIENLDTGATTTLPADFVFLMTGYRPDAAFLGRVGIQLEGEALIPKINPGTYETNVEGIYVAGSVVGGEETSKVFIENGKLHGRVIVDDIRKKMSLVNS